MQLFNLRMVFRFNEKSPQNNHELTLNKFMTKFLAHRENIFLGLVNQFKSNLFENVSSSLLKCSFYAFSRIRILIFFLKLTKVSSSFSWLYRKLMVNAILPGSLWASSLSEIKDGNKLFELVGNIWQFFCFDLLIFAEKITKFSNSQYFNDRFSVVKLQSC